MNTSTLNSITLNRDILEIQEVIQTYFPIILFKDTKNYVNINIYTIDYITINLKILGN